MTSQSIDDDQQQKIGAINYEVMVHRIRQHGKPCCAPEYLKQDIDYTQKRAEARHKIGISSGSRASVSLFISPNCPPEITKLSGYLSRCSLTSPEC